MYQPTALQQIDTLPAEAQAELLRAAEVELSRLDCEESLAEFTRQAWHIIEPGTPLKGNWHIEVVAAYIQAFFEGRIKRLIVNVPPGSLKSVLFAVMGPAWKWTQRPEARIISLTNEIALATRDNRRMRQIIESDWYQARWPLKIAGDQSEKTLFENQSRGFRQGLGLTGNITGKRGDYLLIDDPVDAQKAFSDLVIKGANDTYDNVVSSRLNDPVEDSIGLIMQRLRDNDLTGHLMAKKQTKWVKLSIPMEYEGVPDFDPVADLGPEYAHLADPRTEYGELMFPDRFPRVVVEASKEDLGSYGTAGQLQQRPQPLGGGILKKHYWRKWPKSKPMPEVLHIFASYDTAFTEKDLKTNAYTARTTWGVFLNEETGRHCVIMLEAWWDRVGYPELRKEAIRQYKEWDCDRLLVERKASGISLLQDLRRLRIPFMGYDPGRFDKVARAHVAAPTFEAGLVYYPDRQWAEDVIDFVSSFPAGGPPSADITDTVTQAAMYLKKGWWLQPPEEDDLPAVADEYDDEDNPQPEVRAAYG